MALPPKNHSDRLGKKEKSWPDFALWSQSLWKGSEEKAPSKPLDPALYMVATPIGNLGDITLRALWVLKNADLLLCEDTRVTGSMLSRYGISKPLISCHDHNETGRISEVLARISSGGAIAFVSDAGTPLVSDPGFRLVRACRDNNLPVFAIPGASACLTALACAGLPADRFFFHGFLPTKKGARQDILRELAGLKATLLFYETAPRLADTLNDMLAVFSGSRRACVARELTKLFEDVVCEPLDALCALASQDCFAKGELVVLVEPASENPSTDEDLDTTLVKALQTMSVKDAAAFVAKALNLKKSTVYQRALTLSGTKK
ncbi:MAG: 16S rRNA (cytidine(1402)-2'-O)-methyltransferase [Proteobacteria bacterium]|jgi:16S rRNA (cytidine1402-2'-O)-methyltransferase|nr:16S rRNA (cytidine(1402)-2'-O)-methyltransferase [Alphaproteobacteria bacterium]NCC03636.1 16S rRNA (cytidine(1402)-2'-O)-methyltransferase [Pseudomonadota bacterium]